MARKPGPMNPDSVAGNARLGVGRGSNAGRSQKSSVDAKAIQAKTKATLANTRLATNKNISVERVFPSGAYRVTDLSTFASKQFMGYTKAQAIKLFKKSK